MQSALKKATAIVLVAMLSLPLLGPHHYFPIPTFYQEWLAAVLGVTLIALTAQLNAQGPWTLPRFALTPVLLALFVWLQLLLGLNIVFGSAVFGSLWMLWAACVMVAVCQLERHLGRERIAELVASALLCGALIQAATGIFQYWLPHLRIEGVFPAGGAIKGNIAQPNSFADHLWLGVIGGAYLFIRGRLGTVFSLSTVLPLIALSLLSGSRSVYLYATACTVWAAVYAVTADSTPDKRRCFTVAASILPMLLLAHGGLSLLGDDTITGAQRVASQGSYDPVRLTLWRAALDIFLDHPLLGAGFDSFSREFFLRIERFPINGLGVPEHSHNLLTELVAETGLIGLLIMLGGAVLLLWNQRSRRPDSPACLAIGVLFVLGIHSLLEYPLWYGYFLGIACVALALLDRNRFDIRARPLRRSVWAVVVVSLLATLMLWRVDYETLEDAAQGYSFDGKTLPREVRAERLVVSYDKTIWRSYAALQIAAVAPLEREEAAALALRCSLVAEAVHFSPIREAIFRHAALQAMCGQTGAAELTLKRAMAAYPSDVRAALALLEASPAADAELRPLIAQLRQRSF